MRLFLILFIVISTSYAYADSVLPELKIKKINDNVYIHKSFHKTESFGVVSSNGLIVIEEGKAFIVDTPWSIEDTEKLIHWIKQSGYEPIGSISTHSHDDRTTGIEWLNNHSVPTYASVLTNKILANKGKALAKNTFTQSEFQIESGLIEAFYPGAGHTIDNIVIWLPKSKLLFGGCFVKSLHSKNLGYTGEASIEQWPASIDKVLLKYPQAETIIPGHGKSGDIHLLTHTKNLAQSAIEKL